MSKPRLQKAVAIAKRGDASVVYLNADLAKIPKVRTAVNLAPAARSLA